MIPRDFLEQPNHPFYGHYTCPPALATGELENFVSAKFYCPHALADGNQYFRIREKTPDFSSTVLYHALSPYLFWNKWRKKTEKRDLHWVLHYNGGGGSIKNVSELFIFYMIYCPCIITLFVFFIGLVNS